MTSHYESATGTVALEVLRQEATEADGNNASTAELEKKQDKDEGDNLTILTTSPYSTWRQVFAVALLAFINFISFSDRHTVPSILNMLKESFHVESDSEMGLIQTTYIITYMAVSPLWGYVGDRFNRRIILAAALLIWGITSLMSAFVPENMFWLFVVLRAATGIGQACCTIISPPLISDLFIGPKRTLGILCYQLGLLLGSGFGFIIATIMSTRFDDWRPVFLVFPPCIFLSLVGLIFLPDPPRGHAEGAAKVDSTSAWIDIKYLSKIKTYILTTLGFTAMSYVIGAMTFWEPTFFTSIYIVSGNEDQLESIGLIYGIKNCVCGVTGAVLGTVLAKVLHSRLGNASNALGCGIGAVLTAPITYTVLTFSRYSLVILWLGAFIADTLICFNVVLNQEIILDVVVPNRRAIANSIMIFVGHLLGDAASPYIVGIINDAAYSTLTNSFGGYNEEVDYTSRQYSLYLMVFIMALNGFFYFMASLFLEEDKDRAAKATLTSTSTQEEQLA